MHTKDSEETKKKVEYYKKKLDILFTTLKQNSLKYDVAVFSDHGMTTRIKDVDLKNLLSGISYKEGVDYLSFYDSTMSDFGFTMKK